MAEKPKPEPDDKEQSKRFIDTARELEVDESGKDFDKALNTLIPPKKTSDIGHGNR
jgi:hypothetical protein